MPNPPAPPLPPNHPSEGSPLPPRRRSNAVTQRPPAVVGALQASRPGRPIAASNPFVNRPLPPTPDDIGNIGSTPRRPGSRIGVPLPPTPFEASARLIPTPVEDYVGVYDPIGLTTLADSFQSLSANPAYGAVNAAEIRRRLLLARPLPAEPTPEVPERPPVGTIVGSRSRQTGAKGERLWGIYFRQSFEPNDIHAMGAVGGDRAPNSGSGTQHGRFQNALDVALTRATSLYGVPQATRERYLSGAQRPLVRITQNLFETAADGQRVPISSRISSPASRSGVARSRGSMPLNVEATNEAAALLFGSDADLNTGLNIVSQLAAGAFSGSDRVNPREMLAIRDRIAPWVNDIVRTNPDILSMDDPITRTSALLTATREQRRRSRPLPIPGQSDLPTTAAERIEQEEFETTIAMLSQRLDRLQSELADYVDDNGATEMRQ